MKRQGAQTSDEWLGRLCHLNVAKTPERGAAPHKPLLTLCLFDMVEDGSLSAPWVSYSPELFFRFQCYWTIVYERQRNKPDMRMPFHALGGKRDRIWKCFTEDGMPSMSQQTTRLCRLDESLWHFMQDGTFRSQARMNLIATYFTAAEQIALYARLGLPVPSSLQINEIKQNAEAYKKSLKKGRDSKFRNDVLLNYRFTCALTGYSLNTASENLVEAAHIHQHAAGGNDDPRNGLALTPDSHWMFDRGLWTAELQGHDFIVIVATDHFKESSPFGRSLCRHHGKPLVFLKDCELRPGPEYFEWHRKNCFIQ